MERKVTFKTHQDFVAACEQLAEDLIDFRTWNVDLEIYIIVPSKGYDLTRLGGEIEPDLPVCPYCGIGGCCLWCPGAY